MFLSLLITQWWFSPLFLILGGSVLAGISAFAHRVLPPSQREGFWKYSIVLGIVLAVFGVGILFVGLYSQLTLPLQ